MNRCVRCRWPGTVAVCKASGGSVVRPNGGGADAGRSCARSRKSGPVHDCMSAAVSVLIGGGLLVALLLHAAHP